MGSKSDRPTPILPGGGLAEFLEPPVANRTEGVKCSSAGRKACGRGSRSEKQNCSSSRSLPGAPRRSRAKRWNWMQRPSAAASTSSWAAGAHLPIYIAHARARAKGGSHQFRARAPPASGGLRRARAPPAASLGDPGAFWGGPPSRKMAANGNPLAAPDRKMGGHISFQLGAADKEE